MTMLEAHQPLLIALGMALAMAAALLGLNALLGPRRPSAVKREVFECGNLPSGPARERFHVRFYLVAILFLVFDIEVVFMYPWAVIFGDAASGRTEQISPLVALGEMALFVAVLVVGLVYAWRKGALEWGPAKAVTPPVEN